MPTEKNDSLNQSQSGNVTEPSTMVSFASSPPPPETPIGEGEEIDHIPPTTPPPFIPWEDGDKLNALLSRVDNTTPYRDLISKKTNIESFVQQFDPDPSTFLNGDHPLITQVDEAIGIECLRKTQDDALYSVHEAEQGGLLYVFYKTQEYDSTGCYVDIINWYYVKERLAYHDFLSLSDGMSIEEVSEIDPAAKVFTRRIDINEKPLVTRTYHYLCDGILTNFYSYVDGQFEYKWQSFQPDFQVNTYVFAKEEDYKGRVLPMDMIWND